MFLVQLESVPVALDSLHLYNKTVVKRLGVLDPDFKFDKDINSVVKSCFLSWDL